MVQELKESLVVLSEGLLTDDGLHGQGILTLGVERVELVGHLGVVDTGEALTDGRLH